MDMVTDRYFETETARSSPVCSRLVGRKRVVLGWSISILNLSVRASRCMARLDIWTVGALLEHTAGDLLQASKFGVISLNEVRAKLAIHGLALRGDRAPSAASD